MFSLGIEMEHCAKKGLNDVAYFFTGNVLQKLFRKNG